MVADETEISSLEDLETLKNGTDVTGDGINDLIFFFQTSGHRGIELYRLSLGETVKEEEHFVFKDPYKLIRPKLSFDSYAQFFGCYSAVVLCRKSGDQYLLAYDLMDWWQPLYEIKD